MSQRLSLILRMWMRCFSIGSPARRPGGQASEVGQFRNTPGTDGAAIAGRVRERIATGHWPDGLRVTCSFGIAEWHLGEDLNEGIKRADEAIYRAKHNGRDRVELELEREPEPGPELQPA